MSAMYSWLIAGVLFLGIEAVGFPGTGLMFAGLGALVTGCLIYLNIVSEADTLLQFISFFAATGLWTAILWKPIKKFRMNQQQKKFSNITGDTAIVGPRGLGADGGDVRWSGTIMTARLADDAQGATLAPETKVIIVDVEGTTLIVKPK